MNKIFKIIWSKARNCYVVVSELAKSHDDGHVRRSRSGVCRKAAVLAAWVLTMGVSGAALAADMPQTYTKNGATYTLVSSSQLTGIYYNNDQKKYAVVQYSDDTYKVETEVTIEEGKTGAHSYSVNSSENSDSNYNNKGATGAQSLAAGVNASTKRTDAVALGTGAAANGERSIAIGSGANTKDEDAQKDNIAIGTQAYAGGDSSIVIGNSARTDDQKQRAIVLGKEAQGKGDDTIVAGTGAQAEGTYAMALGAGASAKSDGTSSVAIGYKAKSVKESTAVGPEAETRGNESVAIGHKAVTSSQYSVAIGPEAVTGSNDTATAIGYKANANNQYATALGAGAKVNNIYGVALGTNSVEQGATENDNVKFITINGVQHNFSNAVSQYAVSIGNTTNGNNLTRQIKSVANGEVSATSTDAINGSQLYAVAQAISNSGSSSVTVDSVHYYSVKRTAETDKAGNNNYDNTGAQGNNSIAAGVSASTSQNAENAVAIGYNAKAEGKGATVIGQYARATNDYATAFGGKHYTDKKNGEVTLINEATGIASTAFGEGAQAKGEASLAFGHNTVAGVDGGAGQQSVAFGEDTQALGGRSLAFGEKTRAEFNDSVAFGNGSQALSTGAMAHGNRTSAVGQYTTTWGNNTVAAGENSTAFGKDAMAGAIDENGAVIVNYDKQSTKIDKNGYKAYVDANGNTQSGTYTVDGGETHNYVILAGTDNKKYICDYHGDIHEVTSIDANGVITAGKAVPNAPVTKIVGGTNGFNVDGHQNATAFGNATRATAAESTAWGQGSIASGEASTAFGIKSKAEGKNSLAGLGGQAVNENSIALGKDTKANNAQQAVSVAIGENAEASGARSLAIGFGVKGKVTEGGVEKDDTTLTQTTASGESAVSIGTDTQAAGQHSIAFGSHTEATKDSSLAIGYDTHATEASAVAIGSGTKVNRGFGVAVGLSALAGIDESDPSSSDADGSQTVAFGYYARATATNAAALGAATSANVNGGVALGYGSATTRAAGNQVNGVEQKAYLKPASVDSTNNSTWTSTAGAVSVGNVGAKQSITRQITDVAAGSLDTDAVNVAQLKAVSGSHTAVTVNDKSNPTIATAGDKTYGDYAGGETDNLHIAAMKGTDGKLTYNIKLNDQLSIGKKGADGTNGKVTVDTKGGTTVIIGHDGENGKDGKDGLFVRGDDGKDGKSGISITGPNGLDGIDGTIGIAGKDGKDAVSISGKDGAGHIGLTGPKGADGKDGTSIDLSTDYGTKTLNSEKNTTVDGVEKASRIIYSDARGDHEVATMDDGQKYHGDFGETANVALNHQVNIVGDISSYNANHPDSKVEQSALTDGTANVGVETTKDDQGNATLTIKLNKNLTGLESVTAGGAKLGTHQDGDSSLAVYEIDAKGKPVSKTDGNGKTVTDKKGTYVTGLTNTTWDGKTYVSGRAATEDQLMQITSSIVNQGATGGFGLSANGQNVKQDLGKTIAINGDGTYSPDGKETEAGNISTSVEKGAIKVFLNKDLNINSTTMEGEDKDGNTVSNVTNAEGSTITKTDANGKQSSTTVNAGSLTIKDGDGTTTIGGGKATIGGVTINGTGENDGSDQHNSTIKGLSNTTFDTTHLNQYINSDRAATEGQLKDVYDMASKHTTVTVNGKDAPSTDGNLILKKEDKNGSANYDLALNNDITLGDKDSNGKLTVKSKDGTKSIITDGEKGTLTFKNGNDETSMKAADSAKGVDGTTDIKRVAVDGHTVATMDDGMKFAGDSGEALKQKLNSTTNIKGGAAGELSDGNIGVVSDGKDTLTVKLAKDIRGLDSVEATTVNATTVNSSSFNIAGDSNHSAITIQQGNVNMGGNTISGVAPGKVSADSTDAVNGSQLWQRDQAINGLSGSVNKLGNRINRVGAGAAALAALHPLDFDPDDKWDFAAGYGNYRGANAAAVGAYYRPNEDTMFSVGGSFGGGENMVNAGVSIKLGQGNHVSTSRVAMAKEMKAMRQHMAEQDALIAKLQSMHGMAVDPAKSVLFPDVAENHWAYQYVTTLAKKGILEGYPDGEFKGDRMMTRYEFAAIVYRIVESGVGSTDPELSKLVKEFSPELQYIRIDTIQKDRNGKPTIERVRVISDAK